LVIASFTELKKGLMPLFLLPYFNPLYLCKKYSMSIVTDFNEYRERMNEVILGNGNLVMKRLWNLDTNTYQEGALDVKTKEMLGLVASMVLRCDDCIKYHLGKCNELGMTTDEVYEVFSVANIVGGTIVIPHTRRAAEYWEVLLADEKKD
jgi:AhpD family alkylhydroperoxidase